MGSNTAPSLQVLGWSATEFVLGVQGTFGYRFAVERSTNLTTWESLTTNTAPFTFIDTNISSAPVTVYRAHYIPGN
jgi:hypothetical protein